MPPAAFALRLALKSVILCLAIGIEVHGAEEKQPPQKLRVAAVQFRSTRDISENLRRIDEQLAACAKEGVRCAVFPECALCGYFDKPYMQGLKEEQLKAAVEQLAGSCRRHKVYAVAGTAWREQGKLLNSAFVIDPEGRTIVRYDKLHLAESWPIPGERLVVFPIDGVRCGIIICHDERYPELVRLPALAGARVIFYTSHESGIREESKIGPYRAQIQARAVENSVFIVQANAPANPDASGSNGHSRLIQPDGNIIHEAGIFEETRVTADLPIGKATGKMASLSLQGPLGAWWKEGLRKVERVELPPQ